MNLPSRPNLKIRQRVGRRLYPVRQRLSQTLVWQYRALVLAALFAIAGISLAVAGVVLLALMALSGSTLGVVAASLMLGTGIVFTVGVYLWLTL